MNWTDEEIDKLFQESASQMNVPYQDAFWSEMEALLPQKEKKKGLGWIFGGTLTCFALIAAMVLPGNQFSVKHAKSSVAAKVLQPVREDAQPVSFASNNQTGTEVSQLDGNVKETATNPIQQKMPVKSAAAKSVQKTGFISGQDLLSDYISTVAPSGDINVTAENNKTRDEKEGTEKLALLGLPSNSHELVPMTFIKFSPRARKNTFYAQAGFGITQSYISGTDKNWMTFVNLGAGYQYKPQGFGFSAGLNISSSFSNNLEITRRSKVYNFGSTNYEQNLMYKQLYSIELPVSVDFRKNRHTISLGAAPTYLATTVMRFSQFEDNELSANGMYIGQKAGLNSFGLKTGIAYQLEVAKSWNVGIQLNAQMIKQVDETQFVGNLTKIPLSGQITIRKTLTK